MSVKTVLIAHRSARVRDRFAAALADAQQECALADSVSALRLAIEAADRKVSLVLIDLGLAPEGGAAQLVAEAGGRSARTIPVVAFAGSLTSADQVGELGAAGVAGYVNEHASVSAILPALAPHLFPDSFNRRASRRVSSAVPISYRAGQTIAGARTRDLGRGGVGIQTMEPLPSGTPIQVSFQLPVPPTAASSFTGEIAAFGRVVWSNRRLGMGIQFEKLPAEAQEALDTFTDGT